MKIFLPLILALSPLVSQASYTASDVKAMPGFELSGRYVSNMSQMAYVCGSDFARIMYSDVKIHKPVFAIQNDLEVIPKSAACEDKFHDFKLLGNEVYLRAHAELIAAQQKSLNIMPAKSVQALQEGGEVVLDTVMNSSFIKAVAQDSDSVTVAGTLDAGTTDILVLAVPDGQTEAQQGSNQLMIHINDAKATSWQEKVYVRGGPGKYRLSMFETDPKDPRKNFIMKGQILVDVNYSIDPHLQPSEAVQSDDPTIIALAQQITQGATSQMDALTKVHDWVIANITYDFDLLNKMSQGQDGDMVYGEPISALLTLKNKKSICEGFAFLTAALLRAEHIPAQVIYGNTTHGEHAWNKAFVDNRWVILDTTWDAGGFGHKYFDPTPADFAVEHSPGQDMLY